MAAAMMPATPAFRPALSRTLRMAAATSSVRFARREVAAALAEWGLPVETDTAVLLTSELVANAVTHGAMAGEPVWLVIICCGDQLRVEVHDPVGRGIECGRPGTGAETCFGESGRGLAIVAALSDDWGWQRTAWGKAVYFRLAGAAHDPGLAA
jgi:anti-sigma regulatory factor (Ser/Thr protein kinase)